MKDENGQPLKGAIVTAEYPEILSIAGSTAITDAKGRFSMVGLKFGEWMFTVQASGYMPQTGSMQVRTVGINRPVAFVMHKLYVPPSALGSMSPKDVQTALVAADDLYNNQRWDEAIAAYRELLTQAPSLSTIHMQIGAAYRNKKAYDAAIATYNDLLKTDPANEKAKLAIGMTEFDKGDLAAADRAIEAVAQAPGASRDAFYDLGDIKLAQAQTDAAMSAYQRAAEARPHLGQAGARAGPHRDDEGRLGGRIEILPDGHHRGSSLAGSRAGQDPACADHQIESVARRRPLRYTLILVGVALSAALAAAGGWRYARASAPLSGPIIVVSIDTLRADHLPAYGYSKIQTPAIDLLASNGVVFERAYSHATDTLPAHVSLLSGRLPFETGVRGASGERVRPGERLLSQMLRERGYATAGDHLIVAAR